MPKETEEREDGNNFQAMMDKLFAHMDDLRGGVQSMHSRMDALEAKYAKGDAEEEEKEEAKDDSEAEKEHEKEGKEIKKLEKEAGEKKADKNLHVRVPHQRHDSEEENEGRGDQDEAEKEADKKHREEAKKDSDKEEREDSSRADADIVEIRKQLAALTARNADLERRIPKSVSDADYQAMSDIQANADKVFQAFGDSAPRPMQGETPLAYRRRLASSLKDHSSQLKEVNLYSIKDEGAFSFMEKQIYADAMEAALRPTDVPEGYLREIVSTDTTGRRISTFVGEPRSWLGQYSGVRRQLVGIDKSGGAR